MTTSIQINVDTLKRRHKMKTEMFRAIYEASATSVIHLDFLNSSRELVFRNCVSKSQRTFSMLKSHCLCTLGACQAQCAINHFVLSHRNNNNWLELIIDFNFKYYSIDESTIKLMDIYLKRDTLEKMLRLQMKPSSHSNEYFFFSFLLNFTHQI